MIAAYRRLFMSQVIQKNRGVFLGLLAKRITKNNMYRPNVSRVHASSGAKQIRLKAKNVSTAQESALS